MRSTPLERPVIKQLDSIPVSQRQSHSLFNRFCRMAAQERRTQYITVFYVCVIVVFFFFSETKYVNEKETYRFADNVDFWRGSDVNSLTISVDCNQVQIWHKV